MCVPALYLCLSVLGLTRAQYQYVQSTLPTAIWQKFIFEVFDGSYYGHSIQSCAVLCESKITPHSCDIIAWKNARCLTGNIAIDETIVTDATNGEYKVLMKKDGAVEDALIEPFTILHSVPTKIWARSLLRRIFHGVRSALDCAARCVLELGGIASGDCKVWTFVPRDKKCFTGNGLEHSFFPSDDLVVSRSTVSDVYAVESTGQACPSTYPYAYLGGNYCCSTEFEKLNPPEGQHCDEGRITLQSPCCRDDDSVACPSPPCSNAKIAFDEKPFQDTFTSFHNKLHAPDWIRWMREEIPVSSMHECAAQCYWRGMDQCMAYALVEVDMLCYLGHPHKPANKFNVWEFGDLRTKIGNVTKLFYNFLYAFNIYLKVEFVP